MVFSTRRNWLAQTAVILPFALLYYFASSWFESNLTIVIGGFLILELFVLLLERRGGRDH